MTADITIARGVNNTPCKIPLYNAPDNTPFSEIDKCEIVNRVASSAGKASSILSRLPEVQGYTDIEGTTVKMVTCIGGEQMEDIVTMVGEKQYSYVVRIEGKEYAIRKSIARFVVYRGE